MTNSSSADSRNVMRAAQLTKTELDEVCARLDELRPSHVRQDQVSATIKEVVRRAIRRGVNLDQLNASLALTKLSISKHQFSELTRDDQGKGKTKQAERFEQARPTKTTRHPERAQPNEQVELSEQAQAGESATSDFGEKVHAIAMTGEQDGRVEAANEQGDKSRHVPDADHRGVSNAAHATGTQDSRSLTTADTAFSAGLSSSRVDEPVPGASHPPAHAALRMPTATSLSKKSAMP